MSTKKFGRLNYLAQSRNLTAYRMNRGCDTRPLSTITEFISVFKNQHILQLYANQDKLTFPAIVKDLEIVKIIQTNS